MKFFSHVFCLFAMCCQLLAATGLIYHNHECSDSKRHPVSNENAKVIQYSNVNDSCCGHSHHSDKNEPELTNFDSDQTLQDIPHHHPCNCLLYIQLDRVIIEVNTGPSHKNTNSHYFPIHANRHHYQSQNPSQAPTQKFLYVSPPRGSSGVALMHIHCIYLI